MPAFPPQRTKLYRQKCLGISALLPHNCMAMNGIEAPTENLHSNLARYLRGGPIKNVRLVAWDGARVTFTRRARRESDGARPGLQQMTLPVADFLQRAAVACTRTPDAVVRSYGLSHPSHAAALARVVRSLASRRWRRQPRWTGRRCVRSCPNTAQPWGAR